MKEKAELDAELLSCRVSSVVDHNKNPVFVMEDVNQTNNNCSARMVIEMNTLLRWQQMIENKK